MRITFVKAGSMGMGRLHPRSPEGGLPLAVLVRHSSLML